MVLNPHLTPREIKYADLRTPNSLKYSLIRPLGHSDLPVVSSSQFTRVEKALPVVTAHAFTEAFIRMMRGAGISFKELPAHSYGGPTALVQFRCLIAIPFQMSTEEMYENLKLGVVTLVPSSRFLRIIMETPGFVLNNLFGTLEAGRDWYKYIEYYNDDLKDYFYTFDSMQELKEMLRMPSFDKRGLRGKLPSMWRNITENAIGDWAELLGSKHSVTALEK